MLPYRYPPVSVQIAAGPRHNCHCRLPAQFRCASLRSLKGAVFAFGSRLAVKSPRWPGIDARNKKADAVWLRGLKRPPTGPIPARSFEKLLTQSRGSCWRTAQRVSWTRDLLVQQFGHLEFRVRPCETLNQYGYAGPSECYVSLEEYLSPEFDARSVVFENDFESNRHELLESFDVPRLLASVHGAPILSIGRQDTGIGFHRHSAAWLAQLLGRKLWLLLPGGKRPPARAPWHYLLHRPPGLVICVAQPGEVVFVPAGWWHATWNLDDISVAAGWEAGDSGQWSPEMHAVADGDVAQLLQLMASQTVTKPLVVLAARTGRLHVLKLLMDQARGREVLEAHAASAAIAAARSGHINVMELLWEEGFTGMLQASVSGTTPLHEAARCGRLEAVEWLIAHKADSATFDNTSSNALHVAAAFGQTAVVQLLMQTDADVDLRDSRGSSALILSTLRGHTDHCRAVAGAGRHFCA
eukprot:s2086_g16.t1